MHPDTGSSAPADAVKGKIDIIIAKNSEINAFADKCFFISSSYCEREDNPPVSASIMSAERDNRTLEFSSVIMPAV